jgi:hypothetical protein
MALTKKQKELRTEAEKMVELAQIDFWNIEDVPRDDRTTRLRIALHHIALSVVVSRYTLLDEILAECICRYYFPNDPKKPYVRWKADRFRIFVNYLLDETYLLKKMEVVHAINPLPSPVRSIIYKANNLRNAMAHSFFPENRKEHRKVGKVLYDGNNVRTATGLEAFVSDCGDAFSYLARCTFSEWNGVKKGDGKWDEKRKMGITGTKPDIKTNG